MGLTGLKLKVCGETCSETLYGESTFQPVTVVERAGISRSQPPPQSKSAVALETLSSGRSC